MSPEKLVYMANQIATFFHSKPHDEAVAGVAAHINSFWEPRMRAQFFALIASGEAGFDPLVLEAAPSIRKVSAPRPMPEPV
ncbi:formate dehydrogenase subunit delta [Breoghania sp. L-A4]|uniref:formate dehydrogenase subunit delta n=1 Tax=Breoghania sp. L-A4 TaxID=2304600 RepID=UPI000E35FECA|nr:formate dehydrogenase subunit delta [Breoghania sp. L-A4]AXS42727.1 formate dehydrogenase [Breoghania sp. L-A4]